MVCPKTSLTLADNERAKMSVPPPAAYGTTKRIGLSGYFCAYPPEGSMLRKPAKIMKANSNLLGDMRNPLGIVQETHSMSSIDATQELRADEATH